MIVLALIGLRRSGIQLSRVRQFLHHDDYPVIQPLATVGWSLSCNINSEVGMVDLRHALIMLPTLAIGAGTAIAERKSKADAKENQLLNAASP